MFGLMKSQSCNSDVQPFNWNYRLYYCGTCKTIAAFKRKKFLQKIKCGYSPGKGFSAKIKLRGGFEEGISERRRHRDDLKKGISAATTRSR
jgi:hypothetical protein